MYVELSLGDFVIFACLFSLLSLYLIRKGKRLMAVVDNLNAAVVAMEAQHASLATAIDNHLTVTAQQIANGANVHDPLIQAAADKINSISTAIAAEIAKLKI